MVFDFECLEDGRWYVVFPEYEGSHEDLEMVEGADKMLDALSTDGLYATLSISEEDTGEPDIFRLEMEAHDDDGAWYNVVGCPQFRGPIWLCNVTHEFFEDHPELLYCRVID